MCILRVMCIILEEYFILWLCLKTHGLIQFKKTPNLLSWYMKIRWINRRHTISIVYIIQIWLAKSKHHNKKNLLMERSTHLFI